MMVYGEPWFRGNDMAIILGYARPRDAIRDHIPDHFKNTLGHLKAKSSVSGETPLTNLPARNTEDLSIDSDDDTDSHQKPKKFNNSTTNADKAVLW